MKTAAQDCRLGGRTRPRCCHPCRCCCCCCCHSRSHKKSAFQRRSPRSRCCCCCCCWGLRCRLKTTLAPPETLKTEDEKARGGGWAPWGQDSGQVNKLSGKSINVERESTACTAAARASRKKAVPDVLAPGGVLQLSSMEPLPHCVTAM